MARAHARRHAQTGRNAEKPARARCGAYVLLTAAKSARRSASRYTQCRATSLSSSLCSHAKHARTGAGAGSCDDDEEGAEDDDDDDDDAEAEEEADAEAEDAAAAAGVTDWRRWRHCPRSALTLSTTPVGSCAACAAPRRARDAGDAGEECQVAEGAASVCGGDRHCCCCCGMEEELEEEEEQEEACNWTPREP